MSGLLLADIGIFLFLFSSILLPILLVYLFRRLVDKKSFASLGVGFENGWLKKLAFGLLIGAILASAVFLIQIISGWAILTGREQEGATSLFSGLLVIVLISGVGASITEELTFRGYILQNLSEDWGVAVGLILSSFIFGYAHFLNPHFSLLIGLNLTMAGALFAYAYLRSGSLWLPIGLHFAWNFFEGFIFGFPVSGIGAGEVSLLSSKAIGPAFVTGGVFGPEGGLVGVAVYLIGFLILRMVRFDREIKKSA